MADPSIVCAQSTSPRDQDEEYEGEGDFQAREGDVVPTETKYWRIQPISGEHKPKWRNCHTAVLQNESRMIVRLFSSLSAFLPLSISLISFYNV